MPGNAVADRVAKEKCTIDQLEADINVKSAMTKLQQAQGLKEESFVIAT